MQLRRTWRLWSIVFLGCLTFTLWGERVDGALEDAFGGLPVGVYLKFYTVILAAHQNVFILSDLELSALHRKQVILLAPFALTIATSLLVGAWCLDWRVSPYLRLAVIAVRDCLLAIYIVNVFIPVTLAIRKREVNPSLHFRETATVGFFAAYLGVAFGNMTVFLLASLRSPLTEQAQTFFHPLIYLCALGFGLMYIPKRWITTAAHARRVWVAYRVRQIARHIASLVGHPALQHTHWLYLWRYPAVVDTHLHRDVMFIIDYAPQIAPGAIQGHPEAQVLVLLSTTLDYEQLIEALAKL
ncbi:MAG: hypothetical protein SF123_04250 [Chloroflexota bacterium]|nr:hypothetical protein [Chloroflexota bacterium]